MNPKYADSMIGAGKSYYALGVYDRALDMFNDALKVDRKSVSAMNGAGFVLTDTGRFTEAIGYFDRASAVSGSSMESRYGLAYVYYRMDKRVWAKRKLENIFNTNPYHFDSLLLMADIKADDNRLDEARAFIMKAIDSDRESPVGHIKYGNILFRSYMAGGNSDYLAEAEESFSRALSINPDNYRANMSMGLIAFVKLQEKNFLISTGGGAEDEEYATRRKDAVAYFLKASGVVKNRATLYSLAMAYELSGNNVLALEKLLEAFAKYPSDSLLKSRLENFLVLNQYKTGHPARIMLSRENYDLARSAMKESLHENVIYYLRRSLLLNPLNREVREKLISYYSILDYNRLYIDEIKNLLLQYPLAAYQDKLNVAVIRRRDRLYHQEGYSSEPVPRDVPSVVVLNFNSGGRITEHPDAGRVFSRTLTFAMQQFGRMKTAGPAQREEIAGNLSSRGGDLFQSIKSLKNSSEKEKFPVDYIVYGEIYENNNFISIDAKILDINRGYVIGEFSRSAKGRESLGVLSMKTASEIYGMIPYSGRVLKVKDNGILVNLGLVDGIKAGSDLVVYRNTASKTNNEIRRYSEILTVKEADTYLSYAEPSDKKILNQLDSTYKVYPLKKRRAKLLD